MFIHLRRTKWPILNLGGAGDQCWSSYHGVRVLLQLLRGHLLLVLREQVAQEGLRKESRSHQSWSQKHQIATSDLSNKGNTTGTAAAVTVQRVVVFRKVHFIHSGFHPSGAQGRQGDIGQRGAAEGHGHSPPQGHPPPAVQLLLLCEKWSFDLWRPAHLELLRRYVAAAVDVVLPPCLQGAVESFNHT